MSCRVAAADLRQFVEECLLAVGMNSEDANIVADALVSTDAMGIYTHGTKLLEGYLRKLKAGGYRPHAVPRVEREGPAWAVVDGASALGQVGCTFAMNLAISKCKQFGIAYVGLRNTGHIGAAGCYALLAARQGAIGVVTGNDIPSVAAPGSRGAVLGSNPLAYAIPVAHGDSIVLDISTAAVAGGKVYAAYQRGEQIPAGWLIDREGLPTTDASLYPARASLAPMAGHKGYGLALLCEVLSAVLPGGHATWKVGSWIFDPPSQPSWHNASFIALDVASISSPEAFDSRLQTLIDEIHRASTAAGVDRLLLPGEREWQNAGRARDAGIEIPPDVLEKLRSCSRLTQVTAPWLDSQSILSPSDKAEA